MKILATLIAYCCCLLTMNAQQQKPIIFIDCDAGCDFQYLRQELDFVNIANDRQDAEVFVLITSLDTGLGGEEYQVLFEGRYQYASQNDTLKYNNGPMDVRDDRRKRLLDNIKDGLLPYLIQSPIKQYLSYTVDVPSISVSDSLEVEKDPWNLWSFRVNGNVNVDGESFFRSSSVNGSMQGVRIDSTQKSRFRLNWRQSRSVFVLNDDEEIENFQVNYGGFGVHVWSIARNWSAGIVAGANSSTFSNIDFSATTRGAIEYSVFPYADANTKQFILTYSLGPRFNDYQDSTIFDQVLETRLRHSVDVEYSKTQPWGSVFIGTSFNQYLHNTSLYGARIFGSLDWNIFKGFNISLFGSASLIQDRINIPKLDLTDEEILLQTRQRNTNFNYFTSVSIGYRFGSKFNNIVNNRLTEEF